MQAVAELGTALTELTDQLEQIYSGEMLGIPTGFSDLDNILTTGFAPGALYVIGARPTMGKTALGLNLVANAAIAQRAPTLFFSLEMSQLELVNRMVCSEGGVETKLLRAGTLSIKDWSKVNHAYARLINAPLWVEDNPGLSIEKMGDLARQIKEQVGDLGMIVVDYLQLMTGAGENRQLEVSAISRSFKLLARELEVPVILLSQLNRGLEQRVDKRPMLSDLRESGAIEQDADVVMFIYRDEVYNPDSDDKGTAEILIAKQRNGPTGAVRLKYEGPLTRFSDLPKQRKKAEIASGGKKD